MNRFIAILGCCLVITASVARGDTLVTHAGQRHEGMLSLQDGAVKIGDNVVPLKNIRKLTRDHTAPSALVDELDRRGYMAGLALVHRPYPSLCLYDFDYCIYCDWAAKRTLMIYQASN